MSVCEDCKKGFNWNGETVGTETTIGESQTYVTGTSKSAAILLVHDIFGWTFPNLRILADHFAKECNATVYIPNYFGDEIVQESTMDDPEKWAKFDVGAFIGRQNKEKRWPEIKAHAQILKTQYPKVGAVGYCYGGWACFQLGADPALIDCITMAHPSMVTKEEIAGVSVPVQINASEHDHAYTEELKEYGNKVIPTRGVPYEYVFYPGVRHGFAAKGDQSDGTQRVALERCKRATVNFFNEFLH
ncbi:dienelactone hydrolase family protein [Lophiostoma macrostomum CBS 122681]|uniref:Dienelactone hydrolase family protein n=1 Tax=Lophiostoma macrostomum CBS 122681 TaxID=1314788 RepID=A0A6A6SPT7_9PLEO|nr:dienelactone hydrolase family protein [Lophiostoma macrostomum CBS 122681]